VFCQGASRRPFESYESATKIEMEENVPCIFRPSMFANIFSKGGVLTNIRTLTEKASELGTGAKESMDELGRSAGRKLDEAREETGDALHSAASSVRATGRRGSEAIDNLATGTADRLDATASYVEDHDLKGVFADLRKFGRRHLTGSLVAAAAIGFLVGSTFSGAPQSRKRR
jgi:ElaB/YqjD/DUF883 family membrane-anchored ribosome-binding protein